MAAERQFYRSQFTMTILSDRPIEGMDVEQLVYECNEGDMVMGAVELHTEELDRAAMDAALIEAGSDPEFFPGYDD